MSGMGAEFATAKTPWGEIWGGSYNGRLGVAVLRLFTLEHHRFSSVLIALSGIAQFSRCFSH